MKKNVHVTKRENGEWAVKTERSEKAFRITGNQKDAIEIARSVAQNQHSELIIHGTNGKIRQKDSFGNDPREIKG